MYFIKDIMYIEFLTTNSVSDLEYYGNVHSIYVSSYMSTFGTSTCTDFLDDVPVGL